MYNYSTKRYRQIAKKGRKKRGKKQQRGGREKSERIDRKMMEREARRKSLTQGERVTQRMHNLSESNKPCLGG